MNGIFEYLKDKKGKPIPFKYKLINNLLTEDELTYNGILILNFSNLGYLPDNLIINGSLSLYDSKIILLPNKLTVNGILNINSTKISELPDDLYVGNELWCRNTPLSTKIKNDVSLLYKYKQQVKGRIIYG